MVICFFSHDFMILDWLQYIFRAKEKMNIRLKLKQIINESKIQTSEFNLADNIQKKMHSSGIFIPEFKSLVQIQKVKAEKATQLYLQVQSKLREKTEENQQSKLELERLNQGTSIRNFEKIIEQMNQEKKNLINKLEKLSTNLKNHEKELRKKEDKFTKIKQYINERKQDEVKLKDFIKKVLSVNEEWDQSNALFNTSITEIQARFSQSLSLIMVEVEELKNIFENRKQSQEHGIFEGDNSYEIVEEQSAIQIQVQEQGKNPSRVQQQNHAGSQTFYSLQVEVERRENATLIHQGYIEEELLEI